MTEYALCRRLESSDSFHCGAKVNTPILSGLEKYSLMSETVRLFVSAVLSRPRAPTKSSLMSGSAAGAAPQAGRIVSPRGVTVSTADASSLPLLPFAEKVYCPAVCGKKRPVSMSAAAAPGAAA